MLTKHIWIFHSPEVHQHNTPLLNTFFASLHCTERQAIGRHFYASAPATIEFHAEHSAHHLVSASTSSVSKSLEQIKYIREQSSQLLSIDKSLTFTALLHNVSESSTSLTFP